MPPGAPVTKAAEPRRQGTTPATPGGHPAMRRRGSPRTSGPDRSTPSTGPRLRRSEPLLPIARRRFEGIRHDARVDSGCRSTSGARLSCADRISPHAHRAGTILKDQRPRYLYVHPSGGRATACDCRTTARLLQTITGDAGPTSADHPRHRPGADRQPTASAPYVPRAPGSPAEIDEPQDGRSHRAVP